MGNLVYMSENMKIYYFFSSTVGSLTVIAALLNSNTHESIAIVGLIIITFGYIYSLYFLLLGHRSKETKLERNKILKEGYEQGRFEEDIERTYGCGKYEDKENENGKW